LTSVKMFFMEGAKAHDYWQKNRGSNKSQATFWLDFGKKFPAVSLYLKEIGLFDKDKNNDLAGKLDFGEEEMIEEMDVAEDYIYHCSMVWHFAEWDDIMNFVVKHYGAEEASWVSDEHVEHFELCKRGNQG
jgi:hypothetical protein